MIFNLHGWLVHGSVMNLICLNACRVFPVQVEGINPNLDIRHQEE